MQTLELRWFLPATVDGRELEEFCVDGLVEARTDSYMLGTGDAVGVKRRGRSRRLPIGRARAPWSSPASSGPVELKRRLTTTSVVVAREPSPLVADAELWDKTREGAPASAPSWISIDKRRVLRHLGACRAELTLVRAGEPLESAWLSFALETNELDALESLVDGAAELLRRLPQLSARFDAAEPCGYPAWLERQRARWVSNPQPPG